jgi:hypothetical protein
MKFYDIEDDDKVVPGEYLLHVPSNEIVLCGAYDGTNIRALFGAQLIEDKIKNFKKIAVARRERKMKYVASCKGCGG